MKITVICIDCLRADSLGPRMREFLDSALEFTQAYAAGPATIPSVPTCLTGVPTGRHGFIGVEHDVQVPIIAERLRERGFHTVGYSANSLVDVLEPRFDEWHKMPWMGGTLGVKTGEPTQNDPLFPGSPWNGTERCKATQDSYDAIWADIEDRQGDFFFYIHLMDTHEPFRQVPSVPLNAFPADYRAYRLIRWVNDCGSRGEDPLSNEQWAMIRELYDAEVAYLEKRLEFPGDLVFFFADHGNMLGEGERGAYIGHGSKFFLDCLLQIPFGIKGIGREGQRWDKPFNLRFLPAVIENVLGGKKLPDGNDLYWEDFMYNAPAFSIRDPLCPRKTLKYEPASNYMWYQDEQGNTTTNSDEVPRDIVEMLLTRMAKEPRRRAFAERGEDQKIIKDRLRGLGYIR